MIKIELPMLTKTSFKDGKPVEEEMSCIPSLYTIVNTAKKVRAILEFDQLVTLPKSLIEVSEIDASRAPAIKIEPGINYESFKLFED